MGLTLLEFVALFVTVMFLSYVVMILLPFLRRPRTAPGNPAEFDWHFFIPARDEQAVIATTISRCQRDFPSAHLWVIDDASEDRTAEIVQAAADNDPHVHLVRRQLPDARTGKGHALNSAYWALDAWLPVAADRTRTIVAVIDADGRLAPDALRYVSSESVFGAAKVGAAQIAVRMENRDDLGAVATVSRAGVRFSRYLVRMQDLEFMTSMSAMQLLRERTGSVGMGGNGQFSRLTALDEIARRYEEPWHGALLEDYELGLHILLVGYTNRFVYDTYVEQEGLLSMRRFIAQRARWTQGTMQCTSYIGEIIRCPNLSNAGVVESCYFLITPWLQALGVLLWPMLFLLTCVKALSYEAGAGTFVTQFWPIALLALIFGALPFVLWGPVYRRNVEPQMSRTRSWLLGFANAAYLTYTYVSTLRALARFVTGRRNWVKTRRNAEAITRGAVASDV
ncbi:MAG: 1,2-diacylglycerol 3-beta-glucosyltransferase [Pseudonocardiales bacterium]|jgi:cellulose synthase/poly-beta-1,6-N-acetylglucosamine synthase-like glycosyltransferase|nr:multidrug transporter [Pseudonocardiales bacterium]MDT4960381.1 1,2-diacylglycerol 3-beta-glucosyltransferase [Pseudonocardiales bacterium]MDT4970397.1 1,2-diacylglycerol 3-beta-glucosyltransferase [Pseudonocardiales bacterium]